MSARDRKTSSHDERLTARYRDRAFRKQGGLCYWCKEPMLPSGTQNDPRSASGDHLIPLHANGKTTANNIVAACRKCNCERHPEMNRTGGGMVASIGNSVALSPFAVLRDLFVEQGR